MKRYYHPIKNLQMKHKLLMLLREKSFMAYILQCSWPEFQSLEKKDILPMLDPRNSPQKRIHNYLNHLTYYSRFLALTFPCMVPGKPQWVWVHVIPFSERKQLLFSPLFTGTLGESIVKYLRDKEPDRVIGINLSPENEETDFPSFREWVSITQHQRKETHSSLFPLTFIRLGDASGDGLGTLIEMLLSDDVPLGRKLQALRDVGIAHPETYKLFCHQEKQKGKASKTDLSYHQRTEAACFLYEETPYNASDKANPHNSMTMENPKDE